MFTVLIIIQVALALGLIGLVLLQHGKGADMGAAFGSGASATVFGARGSVSFLTRTTGILATAFFINSLLLSVPLITGITETPHSIAEQAAARKDATDAPPNGDYAIPLQDGEAADLPAVPDISTDMPGDLPAADSTVTDMPAVDMSGDSPQPADDLPSQ